jgi:site-specific DNA-cytosine methylase
MGRSENRNQGALEVKWQTRTADSIEERFGLLDSPKMKRYQTQPLWQDPRGDSDLSSDAPTAMGLTCGIGSMLVGAQKLGFRIIGNVEWRDYYRFRTGRGTGTFTANFPGAYMARGLRDVPKYLLPSQIDFAAGHPECGRYSVLSTSVRGGYFQGAKDDASDIPLFLKLIAEVRPRFFLMDDLPASFDALPMAEYVRLLPDYDLFPEWVSNYGYLNVQKNRNRMFMVGALKSEKWVFQPGEQLHELVVRDIIGDLLHAPLNGLIANHQDVDLNEKPGPYVNRLYYGHRPTWNEIRGYNLNPKENLTYFKPDGTENRRPGTMGFEWDGHATVLYGTFNPLHPVRKLPLTIRERARIQGFPDDFVFDFNEEGPFAPTWTPYQSSGRRGIKQTGKAMPVQFCTYVAEQVKAHLDGKPFETTNARITKPNDRVSAAKLAFCKDLGGYANQKKACRSCWLTKTCPVYKGAMA